LLRNKGIWTILFNIVLVIIKNSIYIVKMREVKKIHMIILLIFIVLHNRIIISYNNSIFSIFFEIGTILYILSFLIIIFLSLGIAGTIKQFYLHFRYSKFKSDVFNNQASIVDYYKKAGKERYILNSYLSLNNIMKLEDKIEQYLNTNVISIKHLYKTNKRIIEIKCSKLQISEYSGVVNKLTDKLKKLNLNPEILEFSENDFYYQVNCKLDSGINQVKNLLTEIVFSIGSPIKLEGENSIFTFKIYKSGIKKYDFYKYIGELNNKKLNVPVLIGLSHKTAKPVFVDLSKILHTFINGITGSGKSCLFNCIIQSLQVYNSKNVAMINVDFKGNEFFDYQFINNQIYIKDMEIFKKLLEFIQLEANNRYKTFGNIKNIIAYNNNREIKMPYLIICIDEVAVIANTGNEELFKTLANLINLSRACGIYFICATQRPEYTVVPTNFRNQFDSVFVGRLSRIEDNKICGIPKDINTTEFKTGEFLYKSVDFNGMIQSLYIDENKPELNIVYNYLVKNINTEYSNNNPENGKVCLYKTPKLSTNTLNALNNIKKPSKQVMTLIAYIEKKLYNGKKDEKSTIKKEKCTSKKHDLYMRFLQFLALYTTQGQRCPTYNDARAQLGEGLQERNYKAIKKRAFEAKFLYKESNGKFYVDLNKILEEI
jgi:hypothetical protein